MYRECKRTAKTRKAFECHMTSVHGMSVKVIKCNLSEEKNSKAITTLKVIKEIIRGNRA